MIRYHIGDQKPTVIERQHHARGTIGYEGELLILGSTLVMEGEVSYINSRMRAIQMVFMSSIGRLPTLEDRPEPDLFFVRNFDPKAVGLAIVLVPVWRPRR